MSAWTVVVDGFAEEVMTCVTVWMALSTGVETVETVRVGPNVTVVCGPTVKEKSRSKSIGSQFPLFEMTRSDQSPVESWSLSRGL